MAHQSNGSDKSLEGSPGRADLAVELVADTTMDTTGLTASTENDSIEKLFLDSTQEDISVHR
jgi:hypothetical protein